MSTAERNRVAELQPLLAEWLRSRQEFCDTIGAALKRASHRSAWHGLRLPLYMLRLAVFSPRGLGRVVRAVWYILSDGEARPLRLEAVTGSDAAMWLRLRKEHNERIKHRLIVAGAMSVPVPLGAVLAWFMLPAWTLPAFAVAAILLLGWVGRPVGKPIAKPATLVNGAPGPLKAPYVMDALCSLGVAGMRNPEDIGLLFDVARVGPGYQCDLELPRGVDATKVIEERGKLSAALRRELGTVWPSVGKRHQGHLTLYVSDQPMSTARQAPWPLLTSGTVDVFAPAPFATDQRGTWVDLTLAYTSGVIGAVPRVGKTFYLRELLLMAGLDPRSRVYAVDLKGTGDLSPTALFAHFYSVGDLDKKITEQLVAMRGLREEMRRRAEVICGLARERCPENKVTSELAGERSLGLEPIFLGVDECQMWFQHEDKEVSKEFIAICTDLVKRGPALGIMCYFATQKPDAKSIPTAIADNAIVRICLKVTGQPSNDQILGTSSYKAGLRASMFSFEDKGVAYLKSDGADARIVRSVVGLDAPTAEKVAARARQARHAAARLTGMAAGEQMESEAEQVALLDDVHQVFANLASPPAMHLADLVTKLAALRPSLYGHLAVKSLAAMLRTAGVTVDTVYVAGKPREESSATGVKSVWLDAAATAVIEGSEDGASVVNLAKQRAKAKRPRSTNDKQDDLRERQDGQ